MKLRFDHSKPYALVTPPYNGAVWHQVRDGEGYYFNGAGEPVNIATGEKLTVDVAAPEPELVTHKVVSVNADGTKSETEITTEKAEEKDPRDELLKWLRAEEGSERQWAMIRSYGKSVFGRIASNKDELISMAIDGGLIPADQVKA